MSNHDRIRIHPTCRCCVTIETAIISAYENGWIAKLPGSVWLFVQFNERIISNIKIKSQPSPDSTYSG